MDFGALPPEINSGRMYSGPGSPPMRTASAAWNLLAAELESTATQYQSTIDVLDDEWLGPTSATMAAAVDPYITWMSTHGAQAEKTAAQASAAASAYEAAFAMAVPPLEVAANRTQLAMLVATNVIGQNTAAIAANEAMYGEMWAQDAAAMYGYAGSSAAASSVKAFTQPPETSNPAAQATQGSAVTQANGASTGAGVQSQLQQLTSTIPSSLKQLTSPVSAATNAAAQPANWLDSILDFLDGADGNSIGTFLNSSLVNGVVSGSSVSPAIVTPAITSGVGARRGEFAERGRFGEHHWQHAGRQAVRPADVDSGSAGRQPQRRDLCRWRLDQCGRPDRRRYQRRPGRHARYAGCVRRQVWRVRSRSPLRKP